ncbi:DUF4320 family protein [[Clostridium] polysaccharolyticum]|uniref:DUF4320 family protein n=1 Tax=[Clostridium] polysaccharolyticum TaxID=29364 RepID=A0A1H9YA43_9FIRM|nr:DUF4320 family protein [[Clostridium] polysaccharolyticum]SES65312.1 protein of unknown function [[Clostridium] polysaccharolyticum]
MKEIIRKLKEKDGSAFIEICIGVLVFAMILTIILQTISVLVYKYRLGTVADKISEVVAAEGAYDSTVQSVIGKYMEANNVKDASVSLAGTEFMPGKNRIQLNDKIVVTVTTKYSIGFSANVKVTINLKNVSQTRSGVYWK